MDNLIKHIMSIAAMSNVDKRKVGCVITDKDGTVVATGHNMKRDRQEDLHAEIMAIEHFTANAVEWSDGPFTAHVTHPPCPVCALAIAEMTFKLTVVDEFIKFDGDKLRYDLIPPSSTLALASVLTFGARKYKPNNWRECQDTDRYIAAAMRHFEAYRAGEDIDRDSCMPHLWHCMTNLAFLIELDVPNEHVVAQEI